VAGLDASICVVFILVGYDPGEPPARLDRWWHRSHIPMRGEETYGGFSSSPGTARNNRNPPPIMLMMWDASNSSFIDERQRVFLHSIDHISSIVMQEKSTNYLLCLESWERWVGGSDGGGRTTG